MVITWNVITGLGSTKLLEFPRFHSTFIHLLIVCKIRLLHLSEKPLQFKDVLWFWRFLLTSLSPPSLFKRLQTEIVFSFVCRLSAEETDREFRERFLLLLLFSRLSGLQEPALQALPCSHPSLIKEFLHRYISPHRQCLFSRCCHVPFFALISSLKLFLIPVPPASLPSPSFVRAVICDSLLPGGTCGKGR